jgi:predicted dehydrogenase
LAATGPFLLRTQAQAEEKIQIGFMGLNSRGAALLSEFLKTNRVIVTWLCDVDRRAIDAAGQKVREQQGLPFRTTADFRQMLDDRRMRALVIATPDHWHAPAAILAAQAGKDVYLEKPVSHNPREGELMVEAFRRSRTVLQGGLQRRSLPWVVQAMNRLRAGELGPIHFARGWYADNRGGIGFGQLAPIPEWLDYSLWQGPATERPFRDNIVHYNWHWFWHWGTGELGNNGVHFLDLVRWGLDLKCPARVTSAGGRHFFDDDQETPDTQVVTYDFGDRTVVWEHRSCQPQPSEEEAAGVAFYGRRGTLIIGSDGYRILNLAGAETHRVEGGVATGPHVGNFLDCIVHRGRTPASTAVDGHLSTLMCHLGNIALRTGGSIEVNPETQQLRDAGAAARYWSREYRPGWQPSA